MISTRLGAAVLAAVAALAAVPATAAPQREHWVDTWAAAPQSGHGGIPFIPDAKPFADQTLREVVHPGTDGTRARVRLANTFGEHPLVIGAARLAKRTSGSAVDTGSARALTFGGRQTITVPVGAEVLSDPVDLRVSAGADLAVDLYLPQDTGVPTQHFDARQTSYVAAGNQVGAANLTAASTTTSWFFLSDVEVSTQRPTEAVVAFGDSITDGTGSTVDANRRWPNYLADRLAGRGLSVLDEGIAGNRLLHDIVGPNGLARFDRDVLTKPGARYAVVLIGINDIGLPGTADRPQEGITVDQLVQGYQQLVARGHEHGLRVYGATLTAIAGSGYDKPANEAKRQQVNAWLRSTAGHRDGFDGVVDFDAATRDAAQPSRINPAFDSGDHLHPNDAGYRAMAQAIDTRWFR
ncbi:SGNH/GDSL hydrolase family protein [Kutzneria albida]|uniref:SGNH hydrolase-type esterase domain-containing protein n=1 Tax=Kutzneria albida DSM 43870 TaxID=1449976 RepID=W5WIW8_9PSEU|nr:SGNH/GDSL hydrolase family protein [Kutzneria albida]AHI00813.1 hypothetical protein KALB_7455 [Kutzneria albida DSM 43870]